MQVQEIDFGLDNIRGGLEELAHPPVPRSRGRHASDIIRDIENRLIKPGERKRQSEQTADELRRAGHYWEMGFVWEVIVEALIGGDHRKALSGMLQSLVEVFFRERMIRRRNVVRQEEIFKDGIFLTPDALDIASWVLEEYKATWRASWRIQDLEQEFWSWIVQIKAYCYVLETLKARLFVFFVNGDYRESGPQIRCFELEFTAQELVENWHMLTRHAAKMEEKDGEHQDKVPGATSRAGKDVVPPRDRRREAPPDPRGGRTGKVR